MSTIRKGIESFLKAREDHSPYLIPRWSVELESQFLVHPGSVESDEEEEDGTKCWTDGREEWANHRWPYKAGSEPHYKDKLLRFDPSVHLSRVGSTWWNWVKKQSVAVAFDIDMEGEHAPSTNTVTENQLSGVVERLKKLPYLTLIRSTGGNGVHIYAFFDKEDMPPAQNHNEHTQVALAVLQKMCEDADYDFSQHMDVKGVVFWFWADTSDENHPGYTLIQEQSSSLGYADIKERLGKFIQARTNSITVKGFDDNSQPVESVENDYGYKAHILEPEHKEILKELEGLGYSFMWNAQYNMAHTHTCALKELYEKRAKQNRPIRGKFETSSQGRDRTKPNCYITPRPGGVFQVKRFGFGTTEHPSWNSKDGDTWCYYNQDTDVDSVLKRFCAKEDKNKFLFEPDKLKEAMQAAGHDFNYQINSAVEVVRNPDGTFVAKSKEMINGWVPSRDGSSSIVLPIVSNPIVRQNTVLEEVDKIARRVLTENKDPYGWAVKTQVGWVLNKSYEDVGIIVKQHFGKDADFVRSLMIDNPWTLVTVPFADEYLPGRKWNKHAPQLTIAPAEKSGPHPHWDMIYEHLGNSLDEAIQKTEWCQRWGLQSGADYLRCWLAAMIKYPLEPLPYLFFYGPQNSGKSIFHESVSLLLSDGSVRSLSGALTNPSGFNYEIANSIIGYVEEKDLSTMKDTAYTRMKEWVTGRTLTVTKKGDTPYTQTNFLKMVQMANSPTACPMEDGDTRITACAVSILGDKQIPKPVMDKKLREEAPYFLRTILTTHLPESKDRLRVPMLMSAYKQALEEMNQKPWEAFATDYLKPCPGGLVKISDFYNEYVKYCQLNGVHSEKYKSFVQLLRNRGDKYLIGMGKGNQNYIANVSFINDNDTKPSSPYSVNQKTGRLVKCTV